MTEKLGDKLDKLTGEVQERNESVVALQLQIDRRIDELHTRIDAKLDSGIEKHHQLIASLYANFRQIVFAGLAFLGAGATVLGYQSLSAIPEKFNEVIKSNVSSFRTNLTDELKKLDEELKLKAAALKAQADALKDQQDKFQKALTDAHNSISTEKAGVATGAQEFRTNVSNLNSDVRSRRAEIENAIQQQFNVIMDGVRNNAKIDLSNEKQNFERDLNTILVSKFVRDLQGGGSRDGQITFILQQYNSTWSEQLVADILDILDTGRFGTQVSSVVGIFLERIRSNPSSRDSIQEKVRLVGIRYSISDYLSAAKRDLASGDKRAMLAMLGVIDRILKNRPTGSDFGASQFRKELFDLIRNEDDEIRSKARDFVILAPNWNRIERVSFEEFLQTEFGKSDPKIANLADLVLGKPAESETLRIISEKLQDRNLREELQARFFELGLSLVVRMMKKGGDAADQYDDEIGVLLDLEKKFEVQRTALLTTKEDQDALDRLRESRKLLTLIGSGAKPAYVLADISGEDAISSVKFKDDFIIGPGLSFGAVEYARRGDQFILKSSSADRSRDITLAVVRKFSWMGSIPDGRRIFLRVREREPRERSTPRYDFNFFVITDPSPSVVIRG